MGSFHLSTPPSVSIEYQADFYNIGHSFKEM
jgi:hypothetical protein